MYEGERTMKRLFVKRILALSLAISITASATGCGSDKVDTTSENVHITEGETDVTEAHIAIETEENSVEQSEWVAKNDIIEKMTETESITEISEEVTEKEKLGLTEQQRNSFSMLYYLAITAEEIRISKDNRLLLDDIYTTLLNDINPGAIDETTQDHLKNLRDIIQSYIDISVKRDRLQYIYNQDKAATIRSAVPNPLAVLSMTNAMDWRSLVTSVVYTVVDSYNSYKSANEAVDRQFLLQGWELDDEETDAIRQNRDRAFDYMVDIVQTYGLDGKMTLSEESINTFAEICTIEEVKEKRDRLVSEKDTYKLLGNYWLELAACYYETLQYEECLECIENYNELATGIYRKDYNYVQILPKAIVAAQEIYSGDEYVLNINKFVDSIIENTTTEEWSLRYFAAQVYLDLYAKTGEKEFADKAYDIAYNNILVLLDAQRDLNKTYLAPVKKVEAEEPDYRFLTEEEKKEKEKEYKEEKKRVKEYNKTLEKERETELPPVYEPLVLNCDLLFALAEEIEISDTEKNDIADILKTDSNGIFLSKPINDRYSFSKGSENYQIDFSSDEITIPVNLLTSGAKVVVSVNENGETVTFDDCKVKTVERKEETVDSFYAKYSSKQMKKYEWTETSEVTISIYNGDEYEPITFNYKVVEYKNNKVLPDKVVFEAE